MICTSCHKAYLSNGEIESENRFAGLCESCGTRRTYDAFAKNYIYGALGSLASIELLLFLVWAKGWQEVIVLAVAVAVMCFGVWGVSRSGDAVRYLTAKDLATATLVQRFTGLLAGVATTVFAFLILISD